MTMPKTTPPMKAEIPVTGMASSPFSRSASLPSFRLLMDALALTSKRDPQYSARRKALTEIEARVRGHSKMRDAPYDTHGRYAR